MMATPLALSKEELSRTLLSQEIIPFYGDELLAVQRHDGTISVPLGRVCENLELDQQGQARRIQRHAVLREGRETLAIQTAGGPQTIQCLRLTLLPLWLAGAQTSRISDQALCEKLIRYQREAADVLWQVFRPQILREALQLEAGRCYNCSIIPAEKRPPSRLSAGILARCA